MRREGGGRIEVERRRVNTAKIERIAMIETMGHMNRRSYDTARKQQPSASALYDQQGLKYLTKQTPVSFEVARMQAGTDESTRKGTTN